MSIQVDSSADQQSSVLDQVMAGLDTPELWSGSLEILIKLAATSCLRQGG